MSIREKIEKEFGERALDHGLYIKHKEGLRFELSEGNSYIEMFMSAYKKAEKYCKVHLRGVKKSQYV